MKKLTDKDLLDIWEAGFGQHPIDRALTIISAANTERNPNELAALPIGQRDRSLLEIRQQVFGIKLKSISECSQCSEKLEFAINTMDLFENTNGGSKESLNTLSIEGYEICFRPVNSLDLADIAQCDNVPSARNTLIQRCFQSIKYNDREMRQENLPENIIQVLSDEIMKYDSLSIVEYEINCPECDNKWQVTFDIVSFFWDEISAYAKRLLLEIHALATVYGWTESEILSLSASRRRLYLGMIS